MATYLEQVRAAYPGLDEKGYSDEEVAIWLADRSGRDRQEIGEMLGVYDPNQGDFSRGVSSAVDSTQGMAYGAGALIADTFGADNARNSMLRGYQKNMSQVELRSKPTDSYEGLNSFGDAVDFAQYYSGYGLAQGAQAVATGGLGSLIGKQVVKQGIKRQAKDLLSDSSQAAITKGGQVGGYGGFGAQAVSTELGATYGGAVDRALETGQSIDDINLGKVYGYGTAAGLMEGVADVATAGLARMGPAKSLMDAASKTRKRGVVTGAGKGAAVEGVTEGVQTGLEDLGAGYSLEESRFFDPTSVLAGAIGGGQLGAVGGLLRSPQQSGTNTNEIAEAAKANVGEQLQMDLDDPSTPEQLQAQYDEQQRKADAINKLSKERQDAENDAFRIEAQAFTKKDFKKQLATGLEATVDDRTSDLGREFLAELNTPTDENPTGLIDPDDIKAARTKFVKRKTDEQAGTLSEAYISEIQRRVAEKAKNQDQIELDFDQKTQQEKQQAELDKPALSGTKAIEQTERMFGKDWIASGKYDDLEAAVNAPKFNRKKYAEALDKVVNPPAPTPVNTLPDGVTPPSSQAAAEVADAAATLTAPEGLSEDQSKIFKVIADRFTGDKQYDIDTVYAGGEFLATKIAELAGVGQNTKDQGKSNVSKTIERMMTKVVENQGTVKRNSPKAEKDAAVKALAESLSTRAKEQRQEQIKASRPVETEQTDTGEFADTADVTDQNPSSAANLGDVTDDGDNANTSIFSEQGMGTVASVGQGTNTGVSKEDQAFSESRTTTDEEVAAVAAEQNKKIDEAVESQSAILKGVWDSGKSPDTMSFVDLSAAAKREVFFTVRQYFDAQLDQSLSPEAALEQVRAEIAQIETTLPTVEESDTNETTTQDAEPRRPVETEESVRSERDASPTGDGQSGSGNVTPSQEAVTGEQENKTVVETKPKKKKLVNKPKLGLPVAPEQPSTRAAFEQEVKNLTGSATNMRIHVFQTEAEALQAIENGDVPNTDIERLKEAKPYGWVMEDDNGEPHAHFILDRVSAGREKSAFLHEVGSHVGIDNIIPEADRKDLASQIKDWSDQGGDTLESQIARRAVGRVLAARALDTKAMQEDSIVLAETIAYFLEEASLAGVDPSVNSTVSRFVKKLRDLFVVALDKIGFAQTDTLTAQDVVDLAYGAARAELMHGISDLNNRNPMTTTSMTTARMGVFNREFVRDQLGGDPAVNVFDTAVEVAAKAANSVKFVHNIVRDNRESMPALGRWYDAMLKVETTRNEIKQSYQDIVKQARTLKSDRLTAVNNFLGDSTFDQQWGYDPKEYHPDLFADKKVEVNSGKQTRFDRLSDNEKKIVADIFAHGERMRQRKIALAKKLGVAGKFFTDASLEGPYAPLKRFGNYVGELKSGRLIEAQRAATAEGATKKQKEHYEKLKSDRNHYVVSFFDTMGSAKQFVDQNKKSYAFSEATERAPNLESERVSNSEVYEKVMGALAASEDASMDSNARTAFREMVRGMYFQSMDERSARTSGAKRLNRAGYEQNMMRSFLSHANSEASLIAQMENGTEVNTAFAEAGNQTLVETGEGRDPAKQRAYNSIAKHYQNTLTKNETPIQDRISTMNSVYMLLTSVGYHLTNATQPMMVSVPRIAGDFGNYGNAWSAMFRGYKYSRAAAKIGLNMETEIDLQKVPQEYRALLQLLQDRNLIDQGMEEDGSFNRFNTGFEVLNRTSDVLGTITSKLYNVAKFVEAQNRISTAVAAYDAARANPTKLAAMKMTPEQYATAVVEDTQGNFSQLDAPLLIKSLPKVVTQYRKYQLLMAWHYSSAFKQGFFGESPEVKAAGKQILAYSVGHAAMGAGATGIPLATTAFWLSTFLGVGDDEPMDMERYIKENIDDGPLGQALSRGVFSTFGLDLSTKLNQAKIFHPLPYVDFEAGEEGARNIIMGAVGPAGTTGVNFFRAAEYYKQGDLLKGIEYSMPKGIRSVAESYRLATEGMTTKSGTVVVDPREIDVASLLINAMGLPASEINSLKWTKGQQYELEQYFNTEGGKIRRKYIEATRNRDRAAQAELRQEFRDLQKGKDRVRPFFNDAPGVLKRQSMSTLLRAPRNKDRLEKREQEKLR